MKPVLLARDVAQSDADAVARGTTVEELMERAGFAVARAARLMMGGTYGRRVVVVCGKGNNGGDGLVAARALHEQGASVTVVIPGQDLNALSSLQLTRFRGRIVGMGALERELERAVLVVDALFGVGLARAPEGPAARAIAACNGSTVPILAVDVPSGVVADTGATPGLAVRATATVTFGGFKPGLLFMPGAIHAGRVTVSDIGAAAADTASAVEASDVRGCWPRRGAAQHKRNAGTVLVVAGSRAMPGAAALAVGASVHGGSGLTVLCAPEDVCRVVLTRVPEITTIPVPETSEGTVGSKALDLIRPRLDEFHSIVIGPGLTTHPETVDTVRTLVADAAAPVVLDADGLNAFAGAGELLSARAAPTVLTPHGGELARLLGVPAGAIEADRLRVARDAARALGAIVVLKGPGTVIADPQGTLFVNATGSASLAQGGTGDVLAGMLASLVAQTGREGGAGTHFVAAYTVAVGVWLHGYAADRIATRIGPHPANATALIDELGAAIHEVCS